MDDVKAAQFGQGGGQFGDKSFSGQIKDRLQKILS
jgi:hypothetical protein